MKNNETLKIVIIQLRDKLVTVCHEFMIMINVVVVVAEHEELRRCRPKLRCV